jgi:hypothetical protein
MTPCKQPVRDVCSVDRFLLRAQVHSQELGTMIAEIMKIDIVHPENDSQFMPALRNAAGVAAQLIADLRDAELKFKGISR